MALTLQSTSLTDGAPIDARLAFGKPDPVQRIALSSNRSPALAWSGAPAGTRSFVITCHDPDVPSVGDDVNKEGRVVPASLPRVDFFHWVLVDIPATVTSFEEGRWSDGITPRGKAGPEAGDGMRHGLNDYTGWFAGDADMGGQYFGWDGPCPPWNDERLHHYVLTIHALDVDRLAVEGAFTGHDVRRAMEGRVLATASITGTYTNRPG